VPHAFSRRRGAAGDKGRDRLFHVVADPYGGFFLRSSSYLTDEEYPFGFRVIIEKAKGVQKIHADNRIPADADAGSLAETGDRKLFDRFIGKGAAAGDDPYPSLQVDVARHDADFAFSRRDDAGTVGAYHHHPGFPQRPLYEDHVPHRDTFGDAHRKSQSRRRGFQHRIRSARRRDEDKGDVGACLADRFFHRIKHGNTFNN